MRLESTSPTGLARLVDETPYQMSNICGALVKESVTVLGALQDGASVEEVRDHALAGVLFHQRSWQTRRRFWHAIHARYLGDRDQWVIDALCRAAPGGPHDPTMLGLLYLHFVLRDRLTCEWVLRAVWSRWQKGNRRIVRADVLADLAALLEGIDVRWTEASRSRLATSLLSALRDYGLATGVQVKQLRRPVMTPEVVSHLLRVLVQQGVRGTQVLVHPYWALFFRTPDDAAGELASLAQLGVIRFERAGSTVVLETPWSET